MCGICGFISRRDISKEQLKKMNDTMYHRGPNDSGEELFGLKDGYTLGLAQRRLSILDLSPLGHQPMHSENGRVSVVYNGEIYNFNDIKKELSDYMFKSTCDTEVIIAAYLKWGIECVSKFNGMFAIAIFDREDDVLYLVRDRVGKKPLYYWQDGENIVFASECKPIMAAPGFEFEINERVVGPYLYHQYINAPATIFQNVYKLEPASILKYQYGRIEIQKYWDVAREYHKNRQNPVNSYVEAKENLKKLLLDATQKRMISDVPLGTFLSGGYDSSLITALAQSISDKPMKTFCIGFNNPKFNEAKYAKEVAAHLGTDHTELYIDERDMLELVESIPQYYDEPFADSSQIPSMLVSKLAKEKVTVVLSGDGGDEFFCGYNIYTPMQTAQKIDQLGALTYTACNLPGIRRLNILNKVPYSVRTIALNRDKNTKTQFGLENYRNVINKLLLHESPNFKYNEEKYDEKNWQIRRMLLDQDTYLSGDILCKVDRASMKYSLETRCPILDYRVIEYSYRLPHAFKYKDGDKKHILKDIVYDYIPQQLLDRPKVGFAVPLDEWLRGPLREQILDFSSPEMLKNQGIFHAEKTQNFIKNYLLSGDKGRGTGANYSRIIWSYLVFQQWYKYYITDKSLIRE
ncbi:asparagine synthase (glutamine-hydrolyzing) [bacterium]|nr:asparagine synthase (glutamine-hydrolyzing) [bacterium]